MHDKNMNDRKQWDQYEDECLAEVVKQIGSDDWNAVSDVIAVKYGIKIRSAKKCRERWMNHLKPEVTKDAWTEDEAKILFRCQAFYGNQWTEIAKFLPGRTDNSVKNFFYSTLRRKIRSYNRSRPIEDQIKLSANGVSLNHELTKKVLETSDNRKIIKTVSIRKSERLGRKVKKGQELPKVRFGGEIPDCMSTLDSITCEQINFDFSKYSDEINPTLGYSN
ncbi:hypothetical protein SteCoe_6817 [Stentor coeruleus]|uniref:Myb-like DNA-binding domain containing protein n=1 Tax=Stentor coeruleus TaxID=5963 RepID=A0A1R2CP43_9CILI|nr:hypothetical protein SteCoe_6817 [Stentor coeruleus]